MPEDEALASLRQARVLHSFGLSVGRWRLNHTADRRRSSVSPKTQDLLALLLYVVA